MGVGAHAGMGAVLGDSDNGCNDRGNDMDLGKRDMPVFKKVEIDDVLEAMVGLDDRDYEELLDHVVGVDLLLDRAYRISRRVCKEYVCSKDGCYKQECKNRLKKLEEMRAVCAGWLIGNETEH